MIQSWYRIQFYPSDYLNLVYKYYASHGTPYPCTYYHLDIPHSCADLKNLDDAAYHVVGDLSGLVWEKISFLPVYNTATISPTFTGDERGFGKFDQNTEFNYPSLYGITPTTYDFVHFVEPALQNNTDPGYPLFRIVNFDRATNSLFDFFKISLKVHYITKQQIEEQISQTYSYMDYQKQIYTLSDSTTMLRLMQKNTKIELNSFYDQNFGYYIGA